MRAGESSTTIKKMQDFLDKLDKHVLNRKILGGVKVKHVVAAFMAYKALQGMGNIENAQTAGDVFAGGIQAVGAIGAGFGMVGERHLYDKPADSERTELNSMIMTATHFMVSQVEDGKKLYDKNGKYVGTVVNRYDNNGKIIESVPVYQIKEGIKSKISKLMPKVFAEARGQSR